MYGAAISNSPSSENFKPPLEHRNSNGSQTRPSTPSPSLSVPRHSCLVISDPPPLISILSVEPYQRAVGSAGNDVTSSWVLIGGNLAHFFKLVIKFLSNLARHYFLLLPYVVGFTCFKPFHWLSVVNVSVGTCDINQYVCVCVYVCLRKIAHV